EELERHPVPDAELLGEVDRAHAALPQLANDLVPIADDAIDHSVGLLRQLEVLGVAAVRAGAAPRGLFDATTLANEESHSASGESLREEQALQLGGPLIGRFAESERDAQHRGARVVWQVG